MRLKKTDTAKLALQSRQLVLTPKQRQLLILADGNRTDDEIGFMVGRDVVSELEILLSMAMLEPAELTTLLETKPLFETPVEPKRQSKRSLAATKMYIIDILQMMRDLDASGLAVALHASESEQDFIDNVIDAIQIITIKNGLSYANRVILRLKEVMPEKHLPALHHLGQEVDQS